MTESPTNQNSSPSRRWSVPTVSAVRHLIQSPGGAAESRPGRQPLLSPGGAVWYSLGRQPQVRGPSLLFLSPGGAVWYSLGRQPQEPRPTRIAKAPEGRHGMGLMSPLRGSEEQGGGRSPFLGLTPQATPSRPSGAEKTGAPAPHQTVPWFPKDHHDRSSGLG